MNLPNGGWLRNALLYWDEISTIIPQGFENDAYIDPLIHYLMDEGVFRPICPETLIMGRADPYLNFTEELLMTIDGNKFEFHSSKIRRHKTRSEKVFPSIFLHFSKITNFLFSELADRGLVNRESASHQWVELERHTALLYMALLAKHLSFIADNDLTISTNLPIYQSINFEITNKENGFSCLALNLDKLLPTPVSNVPYEKIIDFKKKRKDNLLHFRKLINDFEIDISKSESIQEVRSKMVLFAETIEQGISDLEKVLKDSKIKCIASTLKSVVSLKSPTLLSGMAIYAGKATKIADLPIGYTLTSLIIMGSVELFHSYINNRDKKRAIERESPFSYLYYGQKYGITKKIGT